MYQRIKHLKSLTIYEELGVVSVLEWNVDFEDDEPVGAFVYNLALY